MSSYCPFAGQSTHTEVKKIAQDHRIRGEDKLFDSTASALNHCETEPVVTECTWEEEEHGQAKKPSSAAFRFQACVNGLTVCHY